MKHPNPIRQQSTPIGGIIKIHYYKSTITYFITSCCVCVYAVWRWDTSCIATPTTTRLTARSTVSLMIRTLAGITCVIQSPAISPVIRVFRQHTWPLLSDVKFVKLLYLRPIGTYKHRSWRHAVSVAVISDRCYILITLFFNKVDPQYQLVPRCHDTLLISKVNKMYDSNFIVVCFTNILVDWLYNISLTLSKS